MTTWATDKVDLGYLPTYERIADMFADRAAASGDPDPRPVRILEVGARNGGGMQMFRDLFQTTDIWGVDNDPDKAAENVIICAQEHPGLPLVLEDHGPFDLIVDDASHKGLETAVCLANLWPLLAPGGVYVIEDWNLFEGPQVWQNVWQKILGAFLAYPWPGDRPSDSGPGVAHPYSGILEPVEAVTILHGMIVIQKGVG